MSAAAAKLGQELSQLVGMFAQPIVAELREYRRAGLSDAAIKECLECALQVPRAKMLEVMQPVFVEGMLNHLRAAIYSQLADVEQISGKVH